jgi:hypothetical protein
MNVCSACGGKIAGNDRFCQSCGAQVAGEPEAPKKSKTLDEQAKAKGADNKVIIIAAAAVLVLAIGIFMAAGGWKYITGETRQPEEMAADGTAPQNEAEPPVQMPEEVAQKQQGSGAVKPVKTLPPVTKMPSAPQPFQPLEGRWEGTWNAGFGSSGFCSATIRQGGFSSVCYDSRFAGRISLDKKGNYQFEGGGSDWSCRLSYERGRSILRCSYTAKAGPTSSSGSISLYKEIQEKSR